MNCGRVIASFGFTVLLGGAILANLAVKNMAKIMRLHWEVGYKRDAAARHNKEIIRRYREMHENGPLYRNLKIAWWICGIGGAMVIAGALISPKV